MKLVIVESPTKAKTLGKILSKEYVIRASMGHIRDLPKSGLGVDVDHDFLPEYTIPAKAKKTITDLKKEAKEATGIILATDPDREGEAIAWHLREILEPKAAKDKGKLEFGRVVFHELTQDAIKEAFDNVGEVDMNLVDAQQARRVLDRLVGYKLSPLLWKKVMYGLSAGRVQSVAVRLVVERERERDAFNPEEYWSIDADFESPRKEKFTASLSEKDGKKIDITTEKQAKDIEKDLDSADFKISSVKRSERKKNAAAPFKTSTLQQTMANAHGFAAKKTMRAAQVLFEKGYITYHRTDSLNLSTQFVDSSRSFIKKQFGANYLPEEGVQYKTKSANAQEAHEAIRPTDLLRDPNSLKGLLADELKTYTMIWKRSLECQMLPAIYDQTSVDVDSNNGYKFRATGSIVKFDGWMIVGSYLGFKNGVNEEEDANGYGIKILPELNEGEVAKLNELKPDQHFTQPPARYSDATLIKTMEELGVGRPSTYAPTISTILDRGYVIKEGRYFKPMDVAYVVNDLLVEHFPEIVDFSFTAKMEEDLDSVAEGKTKWVPIIREFYVPFDKKLAIKDKELSKHDITNLGVSEEKCPDCGKSLVFKLGKFGKFLSCSGYPECEYARPLESTGVVGENGAEEEQDHGKCTNCEDGKFILKQGRFGKFLACSNYPKCKTTKPFLDKIGMKCPKCGEGDVVIKKAKFKSFYGCSRYPDCDFSSWTKPEGDTPEQESSEE